MTKTSRRLVLTMILLAISIGMARTTSDQILRRSEVKAESMETLRTYANIGELRDRQKVPLGLRYQVRLKASDLDRMIEALGPRECPGLVCLSLAFIDENFVDVTFIVAPQASSEGAALHRMFERVYRAELPWNQPERALKTGYSLIGLNASTAKRMTLTGITLKSGRIFSDLFPALSKIPGVVAPFFRTGSYRDHRLGRLMRFEVEFDYFPEIEESDQR